MANKYLPASANKFAFNPDDYDFETEFEGYSQQRRFASRRRAAMDPLTRALDDGDMEAYDAILRQSIRSGKDAKMRADLKARGIQGGYDASGRVVPEGVDLQDSGDVDPFALGRADYELSKIPTIAERRSAYSAAVKARRAHEAELAKAMREEEQRPAKELSALRSQRAMATRASKTIESQLQEWDNDPTKGGALADVTERLAKAEQEAGDTNGVFSVLAGETYGAPTQAAIAAKGSLANLRAKKTILERQRQGMADRMAYVQGIADDSAKQISEREMTKLGVAEQVDAQAEEVAVESSAEMQPQAQAPLTTSDLFTEGRTHIGAKPVADFARRYGIGADLDDNGLVSTYEEAQRRLGDVTALIQDKNTDQRIKETLTEEAGALSTVLAEREGQLRQAGQWDRVRDPNWQDRLKNIPVNVARGAIGTVTGIAQSGMRQLNRLNGDQSLQERVDDNMQAASDALQAEDAGSVLNRGAFYAGLAPAPGMSFTNFAPAAQATQNAPKPTYDNKEVTQKVGGEFLSGTVPQAVGSTLPFMGVGAGGKAVANVLGVGARGAGAIGAGVAGIAGAAVGSNDLRMQARDELRGKLEAGEISEDEYNSALNQAEGIGAIGGLGEGVPLEGFFAKAGRFASGKVVSQGIRKMLEKGGADAAANWIKGAGAPWVRRLANEMGTSAAEEATQEFGQSMVQNLAATGRLGNTGWKEQGDSFIEDATGGDALESGGAGAFTGALLAMVHGSAGVRRLRNEVARRKADGSATTFGRGDAGEAGAAPVQPEPTAPTAYNPANDPVSPDVMQPEVDPELQAMLDAEQAPANVAQPEVDAEQIQPATQDAVDLINSVDDGAAAPAFISKTLQRIAERNGITIKSSDTPQDVLAKLRAVIYGDAPASEQVATDASNIQPEIDTEPAGGAQPVATAEPRSAEPSAATDSGDSGTASEPSIGTDGPVIKAGSRPSVGMPANGEPDILNVLEELGGIKSPKVARNKGGEYDSFADGFGQGAARNLVHRDGKLDGPDQILASLQEAGYNIQTPDELYQAVGNAVAQRAKIRKDTVAQMRSDKLEADLLAPEKPSENPIDTSMLQQGDRFNIGKLPVEVTKVNPDGSVFISGIKTPVPAGVNANISKPQLAPESQRPLDNHPADAGGKAVVTQTEQDGVEMPVVDAAEAASQPTLDREGNPIGVAITPMTPAALVQHVVKAAKLDATKDAEPARIIGNLATALHTANKQAFEGLQVVTLSNAEWRNHEALAVQTPDSAGAYHPEKNILYLNSDKMNAKDAANVLVHESGHFAERYALGEDFAQAQWEKLTDEQRGAAWREYSRKGKRTDLKNNPRARSEWVAMQFARVVRGETEGMDGSLKLKLQKWLSTVRQYVNKWIGNGKLTTPELDAKILELLRPFNAAQEEQAAPVESHAATPAPQPPAIVDRTGQTGLAGMDDTFNLASEQQPDADKLLQQEKDKREAKAKQPELIAPEVTTAPTKLDQANAAAKKPARSTGKLDAKDDQAIRDAFSGLLGAPAEPNRIEPKGIPRDRINAFVGLAGQLIDKGIKTPHELATELHRVLGPKSRPYSQAIWDIFGGVEPSLRGTHDWNKVYDDIDASAEQDTAPEPGDDKQPQQPAGLKAEMRGIIQSDENRSAKAIRMRQLAAKHGVQLKAMQEMIEAELVQMLHDTASITSRSDADVFKRAIELYNKQPLFSARTSTSVENQAYSTPAPLAVALSHMTGSRGASVYEPTAGTGMLMAGANLEASRANEINSLRADLLEKLGVINVTRADATKFTPKQKYDAVHANPPFGTIDNVNYDGFGIKKLEHLISLKALEAMKNDGRAAIILGATMKAGESSQGAQWVFENYLYSRYNVVGNFEVDGELYSNQGTKWPVRVIAIAGRRSTPLTGALAPKSVDRLSDWDSVWAAADKIRNDSNTTNDSVGTGGTAGPVSPSTAGADSAQDKGPVSDAGRSDARGSSSRRQPAGGGSSKQQVEGSSPQGVRGESPAGATQQPENAVGAVSQPDAAGQRDAGVAGQSGAVVEPSADAGVGAASEDGLGDARKLPKPAHSLEDRQINYIPRSGGTPFGTLSPRAIGTGIHAALDSLKRRVGSIDSFVGDRLNMPVDELRSVMSADQIDGAALAIDQIETGGALIIGDETGIGKGRQAAAVIRYAKMQGKVPVFFTLDPKLFTDMHGDLRDINTPIKPLLFGESGKASIVDQSGAVIVRAPSAERQKVEMKRVLEEGLEAAGYDSIFITYSQVNERNERQQFIEKLARESGGMIVILDEAHSAAGNGDTSMQAAFMQGGEIKRGKGAKRTVVSVPGLLRAPGLQHGRGGVVYLSATYAKRPDNMPLYFRTAMSKASKSFTDIVDAMKAGGVALQQAISEALASSGQYVRRERDFAGINFNSSTVQVKDRAELVRQVDAVSDCLNEIVLFSKSVVEAVKKMNEKGTSGTAMSEAQISATDFASIVHNQIGQLLLSAKADEVVNQALSMKAKGEKPVITLMNTMESFLSDYAKDVGIKDGAAITIGWPHLLSYALSRTLRTTTKLPNGDREIKTISPASIGLQGSYERIMDMIDDVDVAFPVSPIDYIIQKLRASGMTIGELTGRESGIKYTDFNSGKGTYTRFKKANKNALVNGFNGGLLDALLLNASGSTGLSIHAAPKFKDTRKRHMIIAQPALDINVVVQTLGRIKRTGMLPGSAEYTHLKLPLQAELRPAAVLSRKMKSLNANTTAEAEGGASIQAVDMLNKYGDRVVSEYLAGDLSLQARTDCFVSEADDGSVRVEEDCARTLMGRLARLPDAEQARVYADIIPAYNALIEQLRQSGEYDLDIVVHSDWDGVMVGDTLLSKGTNDDSMFEASVRAQKWEVTDKRQVPTGEQMQAEFKANHGSKEAFAAKWADFIHKADTGIENAIKRAEAELKAADADNKPGTLALAGQRVTQARTLAERWDRTKRTLSAAFSSIGDAIQISSVTDGQAESMDGALVGVTLPEISDGMPRVAPSRFQLRYLVNQPGGRITLTGAQLVGGKYVQTRSLLKLSDFTGGKQDARYERYVITGNPIEAYKATGGKGKVVRFKSRDGAVITGLLMRPSWTPKELANDPRMTLSTGEAVAKFLAGQHSYRTIVGAETPGGLARISTDYSGSLMIAVPASVKGRDYFLDSALRKLVGGDFRKSGSRMIGRIDRQDVAKAADRIMAISGSGMRPSSADPRIAALVAQVNGVSDTVLGTPDDLPAKGSKAEGENEYYRSAPITMNRAGIDVALETYQRLHNADAKELGAAIIDNAGFAAAEEIATSEPGAYDAYLQQATAIQLVERLTAKIATAGEAELADLIAQRQRVASAEARRATKAGQVAQLVAMHTDADNALNTYTAAVHAEQDKETGGLDVAAVADELSKPLPADEVKPIVERTTQVRTITKSIWQKYRESAAAAIAKAFNGQAKPSPMLQAFTKQVQEAIAGKLRDSSVTPKPAMPEQRDPSHILGDALKNPEKYRDVWETARAALVDQFGEDSKEVEAADDALADLGARPYSKKQLERAVRDAVKFIKATVADIAAAHQSVADAANTAAAAEIIARTGLAADQAHQLAKDLHAQLSEKRRDEQRRRIERMVKNAAANPKQRKALDAVAKAIRLNNLGAFSEPALRDVIAKQLGLRSIDAATLQRLAVLGNKAETAKNDMERNRAQLELAHAIYAAKGITMRDVASALFFANILSGVRTQVRNTVGNLCQQAIQLSAVAVTNPGKLGALVSGYASGTKAGLADFTAILRTGKGQIDYQSKVGENANLFEMLDVQRDMPQLGKVAGAVVQKLTVAKYVSRFMRATDSLFAHQNREAFQHVAVAKMLGADFKGKELADKVREVLHASPVHYLKAKAQAEREGYTDAVDKALRTSRILSELRDAAINAEFKKRGGNPEAPNSPVAESDFFAKKATFNQEPEGWAGVVYRHIRDMTMNLNPGGIPIGRFIQPFLRVPTNVYNNMLDLTPMGLIRASAGKMIESKQGDDVKYRHMSSDEIHRTRLQGFVGSVAMLAACLAALSAGEDDDKERAFDVIGSGPRYSNQREQLQANGWKQYSIKIGDTYVSYKESGMLLPLALVANFTEKMREEGKGADKLTTIDRFAQAVSSSVPVMFQTSMLQGLGDFAQWATDKDKSERGLTNMLIRIPMSTVTPNIINDLDRLGDDTRRSVNSVGDKVVNQIPFARRTLPADINVLGQPNRQEPAFVSNAGSEPVLGMLNRRGIFISEPDKGTKLGKRPMTPDEYREFVAMSGSAIKRRLEQHAAQMRLMPTERKVIENGAVVGVKNPLDEFVDKITREERTRAKLRMQAKAASK